MSEYSLPDFSQLTEVARKTREMMQPIFEAFQHVQDILRPIVEVVEAHKAQITSIISGVVDFARPMIAINVMGDAQFVFWDVMSPELVDALIETNNPNKTLREYVIRDNFAYVNNTISKCEADALMKPYLRLFSQAVTAFRHGDSDLAVNGFTSVLDGLLATVSGSTTHRLQPRIKTIEAKLEKDELLDTDEYAMLTFALTFHSAMESFSKPAPFDRKEPKGLNRHWIAHGRSCRKKTKLDCVKLINLIYGLLLINEVETRKASEPQE